jgi:glycosyltransferase involved in cell wall biosynthesis
VSDDGVPTLNVGCFGAIRGLKNHMRAACAAARYAHERGIRLRFHVNAERIEGGYIAANVLKNMRALLGESLVEHGWATHDDFVNRICRLCDVVLVPSHSETFNIVAADAVIAGVPVIGTNEIPWLVRVFSNAPNDSDAFFQAMIDGIRDPRGLWNDEIRALVSWNHSVLLDYKQLALRHFVRR